MSALVLGHSQPVAKKEHVCELCGRVIDPGERYDRYRMIDYDWGPMVWKQCAHCTALHREFHDEWDYDHHEGYNADHIGEWEPETSDGRLAKADFKRRWRDSEGTLYPLPQRDASSRTSSGRSEGGDDRG